MPQNTPFVAVNPMIHCTSCDYQYTFGIGWAYEGSEPNRFAPVAFLAIAKLEILELDNYTHTAFQEQQDDYELPSERWYMRGRLKKDRFDEVDVMVSREMAGSERTLESERSILYEIDTLRVSIDLVREDEIHVNAVTVHAEPTIEAENATDPNH